MDRVDDVTGLTDDELKGLLIRFGYTPGPIVKTTRGLYEKKLIKYLQEAGGETPESEEPPSISSNRSPQRASAGRRPFESGDISPVKQPSRPTARAVENDRMEGEENYRFISPASENAPEFDDDRGTTIRSRYTAGTGSTPLYAKPATLPGHSLRPWLSKPMDQEEDNVARASEYVSSYRQTSSPVGNTRSFSLQSVSKNVTGNQRADVGTLPIWVKVLLAFIIGVFVYFLLCRFYTEMSNSSDPGKIDEI